jgi:hypothetical protein
MWHDDGMKGEAKASKRSVISTVRECNTREEWCSAGGDGKCDLISVHSRLTLQVLSSFGVILRNEQHLGNRRR